MNLVKLREEDDGHFAIYYDTDNGFKYRGGREEFNGYYVEVTDMKDNSKTFRDIEAKAMLEFLENEVQRGRK